MKVKKSLTNLILFALEKSVDGYVRLEDFMYNPGYYAYGSGWEYPLKKTSLAQAFKRLREKGLIELVSDEKLLYRLSERGKDKALMAALKMPGEKWDGKWRLIIFDIPEKRRPARDLLRQKLKEWGFVHFQRSVWGSKKNCSKALRNFT
ncbi:MAG: hypothetical protein M1142_03090 [Patescibacteria group bacterium]|nr:hypothetical protein [Patescibacteria group bacterium]